MLNPKKLLLIALIWFSMFMWISLISCPLNLLLVRSHLAEIIIEERFIQGLNNVARKRVEPRPFDQVVVIIDALSRWAIAMITLYLEEFAPANVSVDFFEKF